MPTFNPSALKPSARLTAVVDLPTPPLPEATAMIASTPGTPTVFSTPWAAARGAGRAAGVGRAAAAPGLRSAVSATKADCTSGTARTASSARLRTDSQRCTSPASTLIEKNTLPSVTTTSDSAPVVVSGVPSGLGTLARASRICCLVAAICIPPWICGDTIGSGRSRSTCVKPVDGRGAASQSPSI